LYVVTGHPQVLSPKLASQCGSLAKEGSLLEKIVVSLLKASRRRLFIPAERTGDWESYKTALTLYNKEIRIAKQSS
jgi:hypothetical protein